MPASLEALVGDWDDESLGLLSVLRTLRTRDWDRPTPASGWTVRHQVAHLAWTDDALHLALASPDAFDRLRERVNADPGAAVSDAADAGASADPAALLDHWVAGRERAAHAVLREDPPRRIPWFGPDMGLAAAVSARIMETFAHGQDIRDTFGLPAQRSDRLRHIAHLAVAARPFSFAANDLPVPEDPVRVELRSGDALWTWGPEDAAQRVSGDALDFALLATRRRHRDDCDVRADGVDATRWLDIAQAYAGPPGPGRPRLRSTTPHHLLSLHHPLPERRA